MKSKLLNYIGLALFFGCIQASVLLGAPEPLPVEGNPYVELYRLRVAQAELNLERQKALERLTGQKLDRARILIASKSIAMEEYDVLTSEDVVARTDRTLALKKIDESKAFLRIVEALVKRGVAIPLCTSEME